MNSAFTSYSPATAVFGCLVSNFLQYPSAVVPWRGEVEYGVAWGKSGTVVVVRLVEQNRGCGRWLPLRPSGNRVVCGGGLELEREKGPWEACFDGLSDLGNCSLISPVHNRLWYGLVEAPATLWELRQPLVSRGLQDSLMITSLSLLYCLLWLYLVVGLSMSVIARNLPVISKDSV
jgi:hypothetical protein